MLAYFLDMILKEQTEDLTDELAEIMISLFRFLHGKDIFEQAYTRLLSQRLLAGINDDLKWDKEKHFVNLIKQECGETFTERVE